MTTEAAASPQRLPVQGAAAYVGISVSKMNKARMTGAGPAFYKLGCRVVYDVKDLNTWLECSRRTSTSDAGPSLN